MAELGFECLDVAGQRYAAGPTLLFRLHISDTSGARIHAIALRCQIRIEPQRRRYDDEDPALLAALFGEPSRWGETLKPIQFATVSTVVGSFTGSTEVELPVPCSYDLDLTVGQYFHALRGGVVPMDLLFSGTVFGIGKTGFTVQQVPWHLSAPYRLPVAVWRELMDTYFPDTSWLRLPRATIDELARFRNAHALSTWDATLQALLAATRQEAGS